MDAAAQERVIHQAETENNFTYKTSVSGEIRSKNVSTDEQSLNLLLRKQKTYIACRRYR